MVHILEEQFRIHGTRTRFARRRESRESRIFKMERAPPFGKSDHRDVSASARAGPDRRGNSRIRRNHRTILSLVAARTEKRNVTVAKLRANDHVTAFTIDHVTPAEKRPSFSISRCHSTIEPSRSIAHRSSLVALTIPSSSVSRTDGRTQCARELLNEPPCPRSTTALPEPSELTTYLLFVRKQFDSALDVVDREPVSRRVRACHSRTLSHAHKETQRIGRGVARHCRPAANFARCPCRSGDAHAHPR